MLDLLGFTCAFQNQELRELYFIIDWQYLVV